MAGKAKADFSGMRVTVMGLGLNGGGLESARWLAARGAAVTVTDLRDETALAPSIEKLEASGNFRFRYVLGRHEDDDFRSADIVIKNPGVPPDSPYLAMARRIETDISLFLAECPARLLAVTGTKGKSTTVSALYHALREARDAGLLPGRAFLGGNIAVSPLSFPEDLAPEDDVVLELSSWQLGDIRGKLDGNGRPLLRPRAAILTAIMPDHQNRYGSMEAYVADKRVIYQGQQADDLTVAFDDDWGRSFISETPGRGLVCADRPLDAGRAGAWLEGGSGFVRIAADGPVEAALPVDVLVPGLRQKQNLLAVTLVLRDLGLPADFTAQSLARYPGIEHRLEFFHEKNGLRFYNDSAATIPEAAVAALDAFPGHISLVTGGTDKDLDFGVLVRALARVFGEGRLAPPVLLYGTGSSKLTPLLAGADVPFLGPFKDIDIVVRAALAGARPGGVVVLSPGAASFDMFQNEFDRGRQWKDAIRRLA